VEGQQVAIHVTHGVVADQRHRAIQPAFSSHFYVRPREKLPDNVIENPDDGRLKNHCHREEFCFGSGMKKRTFRLSDKHDRALVEHAKEQGVSASVILRDAMVIYLANDPRTKGLIDRLEQAVRNLQYLAPKAPTSQPDHNDPVLDRLKKLGFVS
jgi:hypothetical protein